MQKTLYEISNMEKPELPMIDIIIDSYAKKHKNIINKLEAHIIQKSLLSFLYIDDLFVQQPQFILDNLFAIKSYNKLYYPCTIIELRNILEKKCICETNNVVLFAPLFAFKFLGRYPLLLSIDIRDLDADCLDCDGMKIYYTSTFQCGNP